MKSSQSNFNLRSPSSYLARSYLIATVREKILELTKFALLYKNQQTRPAGISNDQIQITLCTTYSAQQFQIAVHYIREKILKLTLE